MKKILLLLAILVSGLTYSQTPTGTTSNGQFKMYTPVIGTVNDSCVVWNGTDKKLKYIPFSTVITGIGGSQNLQQVTDIGSTTTNPISVIDGLGTSALIEAGGISIETPSGSRTDNTTETVFTDGIGSIHLIKPTSLTQNSNIYLKETPNPSIGEILAFESDIAAASETLNEVLTNGNTSETQIIIGSSFANGLTLDAQYCNLSTTYLGSDIQTGIGVENLYAVNTTSGKGSYLSGDTGLSMNQGGSPVILKAPSTISVERNQNFADADGTLVMSVNGEVADAQGNVVISTGGGATNLSYTASPTDGIVTSDTGTDATITLADGTNAGLLKPSKYTVLENTSGTNTGDQDLSGLMVKTANGSDINNISTFRANLGVDKLTTNGNSNYTILSTDKIVVTSATLTTARTWTLPLANSVNAGYEIIVADLFGGVSSTNTLTISRSGSDTINGTTTLTMGVQYGMRRLISDGSAKWNYDAGVMRISDYIGTTLTSNKLVVTDANSKLESSIATKTEAGYLSGVTSAIQTQLDNRVKIIISDTANSSAVTGTTSETLAKTYTINGNSFSATDFFKLIVATEKTGTTGTFTVRAKINTTNNFATATTIATFTSTNNTFIDIMMERKALCFKSGVLRGTSGTSAVQTDGSQNSNTKLNLTLDPSTTFYLYISLQNTATGDSTIVSNVNLTN